jgi:hypothetical protein
LGILKSFNANPPEDSVEQPSEGRCLSLDKISKPGFFFRKIKVGKEDPQEYIVRLLG